MDIALLHPGVVAGRVVDENGDPVERASIQLLQVRYRDGWRRLLDRAVVGTRRTDDQGAFRVYGLQPGDYIVSATVGSIGLVAAGVPSVDAPGYSATYYPGTANPGEAQRVRLGAGDEATGLDFAFAQTPTARIAGTIVDAAGRPVQSGLILAPRRRPGGLAADPVAARQFQDGRFEFTNVAPGGLRASGHQKRFAKWAEAWHDEGESVSLYVSVAGRTSPASIYG